MMMRVTTKFMFEMVCHIVKTTMCIISVSRSRGETLFIKECRDH